MNAKQKKLGLIIAGLLGVQAAYALPQGAQVVHGTASFASPNSSTLNVTNSNNAIINWQQFNIGAGQTTNFIQPSSTSSVLNKVISNNPSQILGNLNSNGQVYLINQYGILVGEGARINTNGFFASTLNITNQDFLNGKLKFSEGGLGDIYNKGYIHAGEDGNVVLIAPNIENGGVIEVENGNIILAAGESITITSLDNSNVEFQVQSKANSVTNLGSVIAKNGAASLFAGTLKHTGSIRATGLVRDANGIIRLVALDKTEVSGSVNVSGETAGNIEILGDVVEIQQGANINASGSISAGEILIGGDQQGLNADIKNATSTTVALGAQVTANGLGTADGGRVIVFAADDVHINGAISATGGDISGDGGFIETSGLKQLDITAIPDASAPNGQAGDWLIDPNNITIQATGPEANIINASGVIDSTGDGAILTTATIVNALDAGTNVIISTGVAGTNAQLGDITINDAIAPTGSIVGDLTLNAHNDINVNADIGSSSIFNITLNADSDGSGSGDINLATTTLNTGSLNLTLSANNITVTGATAFQSDDSLINLNAPLTINSGASLSFSNNGFGATTVSNTLGMTNNGTLSIDSICQDGCPVISIDGVINNNALINFTSGVFKTTGTLNLNAGTAFSAATQPVFSSNISELEIGGGILNVNTPTLLDPDLHFALTNGTIYNFEKLTLDSAFTINGGNINFNSDVILSSTVNTRINNTLAPLTLTAPASAAEFTFQGNTDFSANSGNFDIILINTNLANSGDWSFTNGFSTGPGAGISGSISSFSLINNSRLIFNSDLSHTISVPVLTQGTIELVDVASNVSFTGPGGLTLINGGRLSGIGTYTGDVIVGPGGQISPGLYGNTRDNTGTLNIVGNVNFNAGSIGIWEIGESGINFDQLNVSGSGNVAINNAALFLFWDSLATSSPLFSTPINLIQATGTITQTSATLNDLPAVSGGSLSTTVGNGTSLDYTLGTVGAINYWTGLSSSGSPNWNDAGNWSLGIPLDGNVLVIETGIDVDLSVVTAILGDVQLDANLSINSGGSLNGSGILSNLQDIRLLTSSSDVSGIGVWNNLLAVFADDDIILSRTTVNNYGGFNWNTPNSTTSIFSFTGDDFNNIGAVNFQPLNNGNAIDFSSSNGLTNAGLTEFNIGGIETSFTGTLNNTTLGVISVVSPNVGATLNMASNNTNSGEIFLRDTALSLNNGVTYQLASTSNITGKGNYIIGTGSTLLADNVIFGAGLTVDLSGGTLGTLTNIAIDDAFNWTSGTLEGNTTGTLTTGSLATTLLGSGLDTTMNNVNWLNDGLVAWISSGGDFVINGSTFFNSAQGPGTFSVQTTSNLAGIIGTNGIFDNAGHFEINSNATATNTIIEVKFDHSAAQSAFGLDLAEAGHTLTLAANSNFTGSAYTNIATGALLSIDNSATLSLNSASVVIDGTGLLSIESGSILDVVVAPSSFNAALALNNGTINTAQNFIISNVFDWNGGTISGSGGSFTADAASTVNLNALSNLTLDTISMSTQGTTTFSSSLSDFILSNDAVWTNSGTLNLANTSNVAEIDILNTTITAAQLINTGTINASPSNNINILAGFDNQGVVNVTSGLFEINNPSTLSGTVDISSGAIFLVGTASSLTLAGAPTITGSGIFGIDTGATFDSAVALALPLGLTTQLNNGGTIANAQNLTLSGVLDWNGGTISGSGGSFTADANSTVNLIALNNLTLDTVNMNTVGTTTFSSSLSDFIINNDAVWTNTGALNLVNTSGLADIQTQNTTVTAPQLINTGIINASPSSNFNLFVQFDNQGVVNVTSGLFEINNPSTLSGTVDISSGAIFLVGAGSGLTIAGTPSITGLGTFGVESSTFDSAVALALPETLTTQLNAGGIIANAQNLTLSGILDWNGGTITGSGGSFIADATSTVNLTASGADITLDTVNMSTAGTTTFNSSLNGLILNNDAVWSNTGTLNMGGTGGILATNSTTANFINSGIFNYSGLSTIAVNFDSLGVLNINSGNLNLASSANFSGAVNFPIGSDINNEIGPDINNALPTLGFSGGATSNVAVLSGSTFNGQGRIISAANVRIEDGVNIATQFIVNSGTVDFEGGSSLTKLALNSGTINVDTLGASSLGDTLVINELSWNSGAIVGAGTARLSTTGLSFLNSGILQGIDWVNDGVINWIGSSSVSLALINASFTNAETGTLNIRNSAVIGLTNSSFINEGLINLFDVNLDLGGGTLNLATSKAVINGSGSITGNVVNSNGLVSMNVGNTAGSLFIDGNYTQGANGTLKVRIVDPINGNFQYDTFAVNGLATLAGTLELQYFSNQVSSVTETFNPFIFASRDGVFDTLVDSNGNILAIDISDGGFKILGTSSLVDVTVKDVLQSQEKFEKILKIIKDDDLNETLAFIKKVIKKKKQKDEGEDEDKAPKLVCK